MLGLLLVVLGVVLLVFVLIGTAITVHTLAIFLGIGLVVCGAALAGPVVLHRTDQ